MTVNQNINNQQQMPQLNQPSGFVIIMKKIWPTFTRILNIIFYSIFTFIKGTINYIINQIKNY
jgi:hypothetical protein